MISTTERRQYEPPREHARVPCTIPVELTHDERTPGFEADAVDLSAGGLSLRSASLPEVGATLHCRFESLPGGTRISGRGEVVWAKPSGERSGEFGLRFTHIDPRAQALISEMIAERVATGGISAGPQPRMATLEFEENEGPITAKLMRAMGRDVVFEQPLDVLALGRGVVAHADETLGHGNILRVELRMDNGTPTLALTVRFSQPQGEFGAYGEYDWGEPESGARPPAAARESLAPSVLPPEVDTLPDLAAPLGVYEEPESQPMAASAGGSNALESQRVMTHAGGTLAPMQDFAAPQVPTRAGRMQAPAPSVSDVFDPLSADATNAALARIAAQERAEQETTQLGTPLAAALAATGGTRASSSGSLQASAPGSLQPSAPGSLQASAAQSLAASAPGSLPATSPGGQLLADSAQESAPGSLFTPSRSRLTFASNSAGGLPSDAPPDALNALGARHTDPLDASYLPARDTEPSAEPGARTTPPLETSVTPVRDTNPSSGPEARHTPPLDARHTPAPEARHTPPLDARHTPAPEARHTPPLDARHTPAPEARHTPPLDARHTPAPEARHTLALDARHTPSLASALPAAEGGGGVHGAGGVGLAGAGPQSAKQMDLTFAGGDEDAFADLDDYELHEDEHGVRQYEAIAVLNDESLSDPDDVRHTEPLRYGAGTSRGERESDPDLAPRFSTSAGDPYQPVTDTARKSSLVRFLRIFAALVDSIQDALGTGSRALQRISDSVMPVVRRQLAQRSTMRGVGTRVRRSAGTPAPAAAAPWKLPRGSGRLALLAVLMIGCGVLLVYAFPQAGSDPTDVQRPVQAEPGESAEAARAIENTTNVATMQPEAAAAASGKLGATAGPQPATHTKSALGAAQPARAASDDKLAVGNTVFGQKQVPNAQRYAIRTSNPVTALYGKSDPGGFTIVLPNTRALDKAAPIALANRAVSRAKIVNKGGNAELTVRFAEGRSPAYRVSAQQAGLEVLIGQ